MNESIKLEGIEERMIANNLWSAEPTHPGELLQDELECRNISQVRFAEQIGVSRSLLNEVIKCKRAVNTQLALLFEAALDIPAGLWLNLQNDFNMHRARADASFMSRLARIRGVAAL